MSHPIDVYYNSKSEGIDTPKPLPKITPLFTTIMEQLQERKRPRWTEIGVILNKFSPEEQQNFSRKLSVITRIVRKNWWKEGHKNMVVSIPRPPSKYAICYIVYTNKNAHRRNEFIKGAASFVFENEYIKKCLVIAKNIDMGNVPYHFIGLLEKSKT